MIIILKTLSKLLKVLINTTRVIWRRLPVCFFWCSIIIYQLPIKKTINIILDRVYSKKLINTNLKKRTMKKLLLDSCTKTAFSFYNVLYEQCDDVSMGLSLWPVLANIILTEFENVIVKPLIETGVLKFYCRYLDDTLVLIKKDKIQHALNSFNSFDKNLRFSVNTFDDGNIHFLDIKLLNNGEADIYIKDANTGLYVQYHSYELWNTKTAWVCSLYHRAQKICSNQHLFMTQVNYFIMFYYI